MSATAAARRSLVLTRDFPVAARWPMRQIHVQTQIVNLPGADGLRGSRPLADRPT